MQLFGQFLIDIQQFRRYLMVFEAQFRHTFPSLGEIVGYHGFLQHGDLILELENADI